MTPPRLGHPNLGLGVGLRSVHFAYILRNWPAVDWFEVISENFIDSQGRPRYVLEQIAERCPIVMHGVSLSIGSTDPLDFEYLAKLKRLAKETGAKWISDHICWTGVLGHNTHDLLPVPFTEETLRHVVQKVRTLQDFLERPFVLENPSSYITFQDSTMDEWEFVTRMAEEADCGLLLDVNHVYVSSFNHDMDPDRFIRSLPHERIVQFHLAGHTNYTKYIIDTHDNHVIDPVWELYRTAHQLTGGVSTLLEWDANIPPFPVVHEEVLKARRFMGEHLEPAEVSGKDEPEPVLATAAETVVHPLQKTLGQEIFEGFAFEYLQKYPSKSYTLDRLGENFTRFLNETRPAPEEGEEPGEVGWPDFLIDLAELEWAVNRVFDGPGVEGKPLLTADSLQSFPAERFAEARLVPVPCLRLLTFRFPVNAYYTAIRKAEEGEEVLIPDPQPEHLALTRRDFVVRRYPLTPAQHALLEKILAGAPIGEALAAAAETSGLEDDALAAELQSWFRLWVAEGFFQGIA